MVTFDDMLDIINDQRKPFTEDRYDDYIIRHFDSSYPDHLFKWHWDEEDRTIYALEPTDWRFQFDNQLPIPLQPDIRIKIERGVIHRIIKGTGTLSLKILLD